MGSILAVEDEPGVAEILQVNLEASGHRVTTVSDGEMALSALDGPPPDLVILDLNLPRVSGFRVIEVMRRTPAWQAVPVIVLTAYNFEEAVDVVRAGIDEFLTKPFDVGDLLTAVERILSRAAGSQALGSGD
jgi:DNA-binding response OmpR family regulator